MSIKRGDQKTEIIYVIVQNRTIPIKAGQPPTGKVYAISVDGTTFHERPKLTIAADVTYELHIDCQGHPFYVTTDAVGGGLTRDPVQSYSGAIEITSDVTPCQGNTGIEKGILVWTPNRVYSQISLYYQCDSHSDMGGPIEIKDML